MSFLHMVIFCKPVSHFLEYYICKIYFLLNYMKCRFILWITMPVHKCALKIQVCKTLASDDLFSIIFYIFSFYLNYSALTFYYLFIENK